MHPPVACLDLPICSSSCVTLSTAAAHPGDELPAPFQVAASPKEMITTLQRVQSMWPKALDCDALMQDVQLEKVQSTEVSASVCH